MPTSRGLYPVWSVAFDPTGRTLASGSTAEEVLDRFHNPKAVQEVLAKYNVPLPSPPENN